VHRFFLEVLFSGKLFHLRIHKQQGSDESASVGLRKNQHQAKSTCLGKISSCYIPVFFSLVSVFLQYSGYINCSEPCLIYSATSEINAIELSTLTRVHLVSNLQRAVALDVHVSERTFYWSDINLRVIKRMNMSSGIVEDIVTGDLGSVEGLAVEWEGNLLYWADYTYSRIEVASVDGSNRKLLFKDEVDNPRGIALYPKKG